MIKAPRFNFHRNLALAITLALTMGTPLCAHAATVRGQSSATVVWISTPEAMPQKLSDPVEMVNVDRSFVPPLLVIPAGSSVRFPNNDPFYHSIYSDSNADPFDIGYYGPGPGKVVEFDKAAVVDIRCHIHRMMHATIIVVDGPSATVKNGSYTLADVVAGKHTLHWWTDADGEHQKSVDVPSGTATITLDTTP